MFNSCVQSRFFYWNQSSNLKNQHFMCPSLLPNMHGAHLNLSALKRHFKRISVLLSVFTFIKGTFCVERVCRKLFSPHGKRFSSDFSRNLLKVGSDVIVWPAAGPPSEQLEAERNGLRGRFNVTTLSALLHHHKVKLSVSSWPNCGVCVQCRSRGCCLVWPAALPDRILQLQKNVGQTKLQR